MIRRYEVRMKRSGEYTRLLNSNEDFRTLSKATAYADKINNVLRDYNLVNPDGPIVVAVAWDRLFDEQASI